MLFRPVMRATGAFEFMVASELTLQQLKELMRAANVTQLYLKRLSDNDNSKNQVYLGPDLTAINILPTGQLTSEPEKPDLLKASLHFSWLTPSGGITRAPNAQLILYPQYPEVRFSGFLKGCRDAPSEVMRIRQRGRLLFLGVTAAGHVLGFAAAHDSALANEIDSLRLQPDIGVFSRIAIEVHADGRQLLLSELARIANLGWINSKRLNTRGELMACLSTNCGGYTLEAELGVRPNGFSDPDFHGWEIKQYAVKDLMRLASGGAITLMTPEPTGGVYVESGIQEFVRRYGYDDRVIPDRKNFNGSHSAVRTCVKTKLRLTLEGYDPNARKITDFTKGISLLSTNGEAAATWHYKELLKHWTHKHALAAYVPSLLRKEPAMQYRYGSRVRLAEGTEFRLFLNAVATGAVYYDPGIRINESSSAKPDIKKRSQFRIRSSRIPVLYTAVTDVDVMA